MRPSKFRLPDRTDTPTRSVSSTAAAIGSASGPELPMQVVQPNPTRLKPSASSGSISPASSRYWVTTLDPGANEVFTHLGTVSPRSTARWATRPAATMTDGFEVFVHDVMAAMSTEPERSESVVPFSWTVADRSSASAKAVRKFSGSPGSDTRSWGRLGPASEGSTSARSSDRDSVNIGSGEASVRNRCWALA